MLSEMKSANCAKYTQRVYKNKFHSLKKDAFEKVATISMKILTSL